MRGSFLCSTARRLGFAEYATRHLVVEPAAFGLAWAASIDPGAASFRGHASPLRP
jgi:hypothetical protein